MITGVPLSYRSTVWFKISIYSESLISDWSAPCLLRKWTKFEYSNTLNPPLIWNRDTHEYMRNLYGTNTRVFRRSIPTSLMPPLSHFKYYKYLYTRKTKRHLRHSVCSMLNGNVLTLVLAQLQLAARHFWEYNAPNLCLSHGWAEFPIDTQQSSSMRWPRHVKLSNGLLSCSRR